MTGLTAAIAEGTLMGLGAFACLCAVLVGAVKLVNWRRRVTAPAALRTPRPGDCRWCKVRACTDPRKCTCGEPCEMPLCMAVSSEVAS